MKSTYLNFPEDDEDSLLQLQGASVSYRIAMGPQQGQKIFTLQTLPAHDNNEYGQLANVSVFMPDILSYALWVRLRLFKIVPDDLVSACGGLLIFTRQKN
jgi:hypothetical protein